MNLGTIYYWSPDYTSAVGGVKILYRHVDILNRNGFSASIIHKKAGFRCDWFDNTTRVSSVRKTVLDKNDYLVIPEKYDSLYKDPKRRPKAFKTFSRLFETPAKKIIFIQGPYSTFKGCSFDDNEIKSMYLDKSVKALMVVSEDSKRYLEYAFPGMEAFRIHNSINQDIFSYQGVKKKQICFMPHKNIDDALQVIHILRQRGTLQDFTIVPIENKTEQETARIMKDSLVFLSFGYQEGFSLPPAEAMACGCIVVGYHGMGGREYFDPDHAFPVETGDIISFAKTVEWVIEEYKANPGELLEKTSKASHFIRDTYSEEREEADILQFWHSLVKNNS